MTKYTGMLMNLFADRIAELTRSLVAAEHVEYALKQNLKSADYTIAELGGQVQDRDKRLKQAEPYLRLVNSRQADVLRRLKARRLSK